MNPLDYNAALIESHRRYLRDLFDPRNAPDHSPSKRERIGTWLVRMGERVGHLGSPTAPASVEAGEGSMSRA